MRAVSGRSGAADTASVRRARFEQLFAEVYEPLQRYVRRRLPSTDVDDVVAEALAVGWRRLDDVPDEATTAWMYGVARNCIANRRRSVARAERLTAKLAGAATTDAQVTTDTDDSELDSALAELSDSDREVVRLWAWEQLGASEIAVVIGTTPNAASIRLHRAKQRLAELLTDHRKAEPAAGHTLHEHREEEQ